MRPTTVTLTATGVSAPVPLDITQTAFEIALANVITGTNTSKVQYSFDDPWATTYATDYNTNATWFDHPYMTGMTSSDVGNITFPVRAVRLNCTAYTNGSAALTIIQSGDSA